MCTYKSGRKATKWMHKQITAGAKLVIYHHSPCFKENAVLQSGNPIFQSMGLRVHELILLYCKP